MTDKDFEYCQKYELNLTTAVESDYARNMLRVEYEELMDIYNRTTGENFRTNLTCSHCCLKLLKKIGRLYFDEKARRDALVADTPDAKNTSKGKQSKRTKTVKSNI